MHGRPALVPWLQLEVIMHQMGEHITTSDFKRMLRAAAVAGGSMAMTYAMFRAIMRPEADAAPAQHVQAAPMPAMLQVQ